MSTLLPRRRDLWSMTLLVTLALLAVAIETAPVGLHPRALPSPDIVAVLIAVLAVRRPRALAVPLVFALGLFRDLLGDGPVGAGTLSLVLLAEGLRQAASTLARGSLLREGLVVAGALAAMFLLQYLITLIIFSQPPYVMAVVRQWVLTVATWPLVLIMLRWGLGLRAEATDPDRGLGALKGLGNG
ncbi:MAG: hypothetical protein AAF675_17960 [Pseudomonadota bacterium]